MNKYIIAIFSMLMTASVAFAARPDSTSVKDMREYADELGYFQRANRDLSDPRFMFHDDKHDLDLGIGGTAAVGLGAGIGSMKSYSFTPSSIMIPTYLSPVFGMMVGGSEIHVKARTSIFGYKMIAFVKIGGDAMDNVSISQAYISVNGLSFGKIPSFMSDLEAGVLTKNCLSAQCDVCQPLVGYTYKNPKGWEVAAALEDTRFAADNLEMEGVHTEFQPLPDVTAHAKFRWSKGHVQLGVAARHLKYWTVDKGPDGPKDVTPVRFGYAMSFSGNFNPAEELKLTWSLMGGRGGSKYIEFLGGVNADLGLSTEPKGNYPDMRTLPSLSASFGAQYNFTKYLSCSALAGYAHVGQRKDIMHVNPMKNLFFGTVNCFYTLNDMICFGAEYMFGGKSLYWPVSDASAADAYHYYYAAAPDYDITSDFGQVQRLSAIIVFQF